MNLIKMKVKIVYLNFLMAKKYLNSWSFNLDEFRIHQNLRPLLVTQLQSVLLDWKEAENLLKFSTVLQVEGFDRFLQ